MAMKNTIKCCISCILPCGALDVIRIVHTNGRVEEISGTIRASDIMKAYPKHVLKKPSSSPADHDGVVPKIVIVPPDAELQRGKIYFLMPVPPSSTPEKKTSKTANTKPTTTTTTNQHQRSRNTSHSRRKRRDQSHSNTSTSESSNVSMSTDLVISDRYLSEILSEKVSTQRDRRRGRVGVWRPHLESICEGSNDG